MNFEEKCDLAKLAMTHPDFTEHNPLTYLYLLQNPTLSPERREIYTKKLIVLRERYDAKNQFLKAQFMDRGATVISGPIEI